ncbi:MAG: alpha-L-rhamnosidase N-terminal domain-containing protein [Bacteroidales bacterium]|nr:alpha-L-rhamnosidase N-terminal domain-containing protein [Bacteroidales bacterium]
MGQAFIGCRIADDGKGTSSLSPSYTWAETPMLLKTITLGKDYKGTDEIEFKYLVKVASLGYHEVYVNHKMAPLLLNNGNTTTDYALQPAVSQLNRRALEVTYDITSLIHEGTNEIVVWLGQGWGRIYGTPAAAKVEVLQASPFKDNHVTRKIASSDTSWEVSPSGYNYTDNWQPMHFGGERFDERITEAWRPASIYDAKDIAVSQQKFERNHIVDKIEPLSVKQMEDGSTLLDFGRVVTAWFDAIFHPVTPNGQIIEIEYLDHLGAKPPFTEKDIYIAGEGGLHHFRNRFITHSFRYVRISNAGTFENHYSAYLISAVDPNEGATFECSDPLLNAIHNMVKYTLCCLTFSGYMVDCPHIERMGYGGDGNSSTMTLQTLWDVRDTYRNWFTAWGDAMETSGDLPYVAPAFRTGGGPYWCGFIIKAPWRTYLNYGDDELIKDYYNKMQLWLQFIEGLSKDGMLDAEGFKHSLSAADQFHRDPNWFIGDWLAPEGVNIGDESPMFVNNCFIAECLADMEKMAIMTNHNADAHHYALWRKKLIANLHKRFYHPETHTYANGTPIDQSYALLMNIPPDSITAMAVKQQLLNDIHGQYRDHIAVGLMGLPIFTEWCIREREANLMATLLRQPDYPGYLDMINNGATTTWESWDCGREGKEDRSRVHNCYNGIGIWFYQALAGIRPDPEKPGYEHFFIDPQPVEGIDWIRASKPTSFGTIKVDINKDMIMVEIPEGTSATIFPNTTRQRTLSAGIHHFVIGMQ